MKALVVIKVITISLMMLALTVAFLFTLMAFSLNVAFADGAWSQVPSGLHIKVFGWNLLLVINCLCTFLVSGYCFFRMFVPPFLSQGEE